MAYKKPRQKQTRFHAAMHHLINVFVPRPHNSYHPHLISRYGLAVIAVLGIVGLASTGSQSPTVLGSQPAITPAALLRDVNAKRAADGDAPLESSAQLAAAALAKGNNMFADQYWAHNSPSGVTPWKWIQDQNYAYSYAGENLAKNFDSSQATVDAWMASPPHRENMLHGYYTEAGFAVVDGVLDGRPATVIVAMFATPQQVQSTVAGATYGADVGAQFGVLSRVGLSLQAMSPAVLASVMLSMLALLVAGATFAATHTRMLQKRTVTHAQTVGAGTTWLQHHAISKAIMLATFIVAVLMLFASGGQL